MVDIYQLDLPHPSPEFENLVQELVDSTPLDQAGKHWLDQQNHTTNSAEHLFFQNSRVDAYMQSEYGHLFHVPIAGVVGIMKNTTAGTANQPPHIDRGRGLAINYYMRTGGSNVVTTFYDVVETTDTTQSRNYTYAEMEPRRLGSVQFQARSWYAYDVCRCHSVEHIQDLRYFVSIFVPDATYAVQDLARQYPKMILDRLALHK